eukprot:NODE_305_length_11349_cov_0.358222.p5 type:complete len:259 gc:universal NODE_305_length_11349_cov_0.358222:2273-1497(-)
MFGSELSRSSPTSILNSRNFKGCEWCGSLIQGEHFVHHCYICPLLPSILKLDMLCRINKDSKYIDRFLYKELHLNDSEFFAFSDYIHSYFVNNQLYYTCKYCSNNYGSSILLEHIITCSLISHMLRSNLLTLIMNKMNLGNKRIELDVKNTKVYQLPLERFRQEKLEVDRLDVDRQLKLINDPSPHLKRSDSAIDYNKHPVEPILPKPSRLDIYTDIKIAELKASKLSYVISILDAISKADESDQLRLLEIALDLSKS